MSRTRWIRSWERYFQRPEWQQRIIEGGIQGVFLCSMGAILVLLMLAFALIGSVTFCI